MLIVDSHCHLDFPELAAERSAVLARARAAGVGTMLTIGTKLRDFPKVRAIAEAEPDVWCSVGIHPHEADNEPDVSAAQLAELATHPKVVGIGETGLDYYYEHGSRPAQTASFRAHLSAARETGLPVIVHTRDADADTETILCEEFSRGSFSGLLHCFSSSRELAEKALELGFYISFSGILTFRNAETVREVARVVPLDRLLVETDAPYLAPVPHRGKRNEPAFVTRTAAALADLRGLSLAELAAITSRNFFRLFAKAQAPVDGAVH
jgi:TatD DNase family protein